MGPSLLTASLADLLMLSQSPAAASVGSLPVRHPESHQSSDSQQTQRPKRKKKKEKKLDPDYHKTGMGIKAEDVAELKQALKERLGWAWSTFLTRSFDEVVGDSGSDSPKPLLPPVSQAGCALFPALLQSPTVPIEIIDHTNNMLADTMFRSLLRAVGRV